MYKLCIIEPDGRYTSLFAGQPLRFIKGNDPYTKLEYKVGEVTTAPDGSHGVFCSIIKPQAQVDILREPGKEYMLALFEVEQAGRELIPSYAHNCFNCTSIRVTKRLWRDTDKRKRRVA